MTSNIELTMPRRPGRPVGGDAEATRRRILEAGLEIFADVGFEAISSTPEGLDEFVKAQLVLWKRLIKDTGIEAQ